MLAVVVIAVAVAVAAVDVVFHRDAVLDVLADADADRDVLANVHVEKGGSWCACSHRYRCTRRRGRDGQRQ